MRTKLVLCLLLVTAAPCVAQNPTGETATPTRPRFAAPAPVYFAVNSSSITDSTRVALLALVDILNVNPAARIAVVGHTDERGSAAYNERLGRQRAQAVVSFLKEHGARAAHLELLSAGEREPAAAGHDEDAWARNRRVEFRVHGSTPLRLPPPPAR